MNSLQVMRLTNGDGVPRLVEASGASPLVNTCFKMLQKVQIQNYSMEKLHFLLKVVLFRPNVKNLRVKIGHYILGT